MKIYKTCAELPIYNFVCISEKKEYRFLIKEFNEDENNLIEHKNSNELKSVFDTIEKEYKGLIASKKMLRREKELFLIMELSARYSIGTELLTMYREYKQIEILISLGKIKGLFFNENEPIAPQIKKMIASLFGLKNRLKIMESNFKAKYKTEEKKEEGNILLDLDKRALSLELYLETGYKIDTKKTSVLRWVNLEDICKTKSEANGSN